MNPTSAIIPDAPPELRIKNASSVIMHRVPPERVGEFLAWEGGVTRAAKTFAGFQSTDIYPPADSSKLEWLVLVHFDEPEDLQRWSNSPERIEWVGKLNIGISDFRMRSVNDGFASWFAGLGDAGPAPWQMAMTVVFGLYPTVMLLNFALGRYLSPLGMAASMLVGNIMSVSILQWVLMPLLQRVLRPWLHPGTQDRTTRFVVGAIVIAVLLAGMVVLFRQVSG